MAHGGEAVGQTLLLGEPLGNQGVAGDVGGAVDKAGYQGQGNEVGGQGGAVPQAPIRQTPDSSRGPTDTLMRAMRI